MGSFVEKIKRITDVKPKSSFINSINLISITD